MAVGDEIAPGGHQPGARRSNPRSMRKVNRMKPNHTPLIPTNLEPDAHGISHEVHCAHCGRCDRDSRVHPQELEDFTTGVMTRSGASVEEASAVARVLVSADLRGIGSHGVARLGRYVSGIEKGHIVPGAEPLVLEPSVSIGVVDARNGLGQPVSEMAMDLAVSKAERTGIGAVTVRNSNHYGIAGYYALRAIPRGLIGLSMTNAAPLVVPTHGAEVILGTNPIAFGAPARRHRPFLLDMATSVVPRGKLEVYDRRQKQMPVGWSLDEQGFDCQNPGQVLKNMIERKGGGILPLGGRGEEFSGYKGYGLALLVDILCGVLSGAAYGPNVDDVHRAVPPGTTPFPNVGHFFLAIDIGRFMPLEDFEARMDDYIDTIHGSRLALDQERIWIHGEKEFEMSECHARDGIPLARNVLESLNSIGRRCGQPELSVR